MLKQESSLLTISDLAKYLRLDPQTVSRKAQRGDLPGLKIGNRWRFRQEEIDGWLSKSNRRDSIRALSPYLKTRPEIGVVYLFGSVAREEADEQSDVDIAVLFKETLKPFTEDQILSDIGRRIDTQRVDLVSLNRSPPLLKYEAVSDGKIIHQKLSDEELILFELGVYREYFHFERFRRLQHEALRS